MYPLRCYIHLVYHKMLISIPGMKRSGKVLVSGCCVVLGQELLAKRLEYLFYYTTNPTKRSAAATEHSTSKGDLESPVESHRALGERPTDLLGHGSASARWGSTDDSKLLLLVGRSVSAAERSVGLVVYAPS